MRRRAIDNAQAGPAVGGGPQKVSGPCLVNQTPEVNSLLRQIPEVGVPQAPEARLYLARHAAKRNAGKRVIERKKSPGGTIDQLRSRRRAAGGALAFRPASALALAPHPNRPARHMPHTYSQNVIHVVCQHQRPSHYGRQETRRDQNPRRAPLQTSKGCLDRMESTGNPPFSSMATRERRRAC